ncbi:MAG: aminotransferase class V-fold PLP-dependent enzyme, partial [Sphingopyxis terrae]
GVEAIHAHECALVGSLREQLARKNSITLFGPENSAGIVSFAMAGVHPHDIGTILDESGVAIRAGHHCAQPLMAHLGVPATARASFGLYSNADDVTALVEGLARVERIFG